MEGVILMRMNLLIWLTLPLIFRLTAGPWARKFSRKGFWQNGLGVRLLFFWTKVPVLAANLLAFQR